MYLCVYAFFPLAVPCLNKHHQRKAPLVPLFMPWIQTFFYTHACTSASTLSVSLPSGSITISFYLHPSFTPLFISFCLTDPFLLWSLSLSLSSGYFDGVSSLFDNRQQRVESFQFAGGLELEDWILQRNKFMPLHTLCFTLFFFLLSFNFFTLWILWLWHKFFKGSVQRHSALMCVQLCKI